MVILSLLRELNRIGINKNSLKSFGETIRSDLGTKFNNYFLKYAPKIDRLFRWQKNQMKCNSLLKNWTHYFNCEIFALTQSENRLNLYIQYPWIMDVKWKQFYRSFEADVEVVF